MRRAAILFGLALAAALPTGGPARATTAFNGWCQWTVTLTIDGADKLKSAATTGNLSSGYDLSFAGVDLDLVTAGTQPCVWALGGGLTAIGSTITVTPDETNGLLDLWTCELMTGNGTFEQNFDGTDPPDVTMGGYILAGSLAGSVMTATKTATPTFAAVFVLQPSGFLLDEGGCLGGGIDNISYMNVFEVFQDPELG